eukprot:gene22121-28641_t
MDFTFNYFPSYNDFLSSPELSAQLLRRTRNFAVFDHDIEEIRVATTSSVAFLLPTQILPTTAEEYAFIFNFFCLNRIEAKGVQEFTPNSMYGRLQICYQCSSHCLQFDTRKSNEQLLRCCGVDTVFLPRTRKDDRSTEPALVAAMKTSVDQRANVYKSWSGQVITDRNNALFDSLTATFAWCSKKSARREIYEALRLRSCDSPYHGIVQALEKFADLKVCGLLAEVADRPSEFTYAFGGALLVSKSEFASKWTLTKKNFKAIKEVKCTIDELMGIAFATSLPVVIASSLYESSCMDGLLEQRKWGELESSERMHLTSPYFNSKEEARLWRQEQERQLQQIERSRQLGQGRRSRTVADISDATTFLKLSNIEKRAILRASGLTQLPRPREGARAVDALIIPLLDEEVAYEVLRRLAETKGNFKEASEMVDFESKKPKIARQIMEARKRGDFESAKNLCEELNSLSLLRFDPTNPEGAGGEWDTVLYGFG